MLRWPMVLGSTRSPSARAAAPAGARLGEVEDGADAVGEGLVLAGEDAVEQGLGAGLIAARVEHEAELGGGEQVGGVGLGLDAKLLFGVGGLGHAEEEEAQLAAERAVDGVEFQGVAELGDVGVVLGEQLAGHVGGRRLTAAGGGQQGGVGVLIAKLGLPDAAEVEQHGAAVGQNEPGLFVMLGGERELIALLGQGGELVVGVEGVGAQGDGLLPAVDTGGEGVVDVVEGALGGGGGGRTGLADAVEDAARLGLGLVPPDSKHRKAYSMATGKSFGSRSMASWNCSRARSFSPILR